MAKLELKLTANVDGNYYVDSTCIDCDVCRKFAPDVFGKADDHAFVKKQPQTANEVLSTHQALLSCPTASIGSVQKVDLKTAHGSLPMRLTDNVFLNGFNARDSYGSDSYFIQSPKGNWLVDSPRFTKTLTDKFSLMGGVKYILLTHKDDVADASLYARHFQAKRIIHKFDSDSQNDAEMILTGDADLDINEARIIYTPGHTQGHLTLLWDEKYLFTGDHFAWSSAKNQFGSFKDYCWYSWEIQICSVEKLKECVNVEWVFPGHGHRKSVAKGTFPEVIDKAVARMKQ